MAEPFRRSPLAHREAIASPAGGLQIREMPFLGKFILRDGEDVGARAAAALGGAWPGEPLSSAAWDKGSILWLGPDERMMIVEDGAPPPGLEEALAGTHHQLVDVSDYYTVIEVVGAPAWMLLSKVTTLDLHPRAFPPGMAAGGMFGHAQATLWRPRQDGGASAFRLIVRWSMADYLWCLLAECGREWGLPAQTPVGGERLTIA